MHGRCSLNIDSQSRNFYENPDTIDDAKWINEGSGRMNYCALGLLGKRKIVRVHSSYFTLLAKYADYREMKWRNRRSAPRNSKVGHDHVIPRCHPYILANIFRRAPGAIHELQEQPTAACPKDR